MPVDPESPPANHAELLWKVIGRYDTYLNGTNTKTALVTAFDAFVVSAVVLKWSDIVGQFATIPVLMRVVAALLVVVTLASLTSLWFAFRTVAPYLKSPKSPNRYHSILFFDHIADHEGGAEYLAEVRRHDAAAVEVELATQAHALAKGLRGKFKASNLAIGMILYVQVPAFALIVLIKLFQLLFIAA